MGILNQSIHPRRRKGARQIPAPPDNGRIAALLERESQTASGHFALALKRASRNALLWSEEASDLVAAGRSLIELQGIGPHLSKLIEQWIASGIFDDGAGASITFQKPPMVRESEGRPTYAYQLERRFRYGHRDGPGGK
jgi:hypothetical protein